jgi:hypothetical protein
VRILDHLATDAIHTFITDFAERIQYVPYQGAPIPLRALVYRHVPTAIHGLAGADAYIHEIHIPNHPFHGVTVVNKGKDQVILTNKIGGSPETFTVTQIIGTDQGMWLLGVGG